MDHLCNLVVRIPDYRSRLRIRFQALPDFLRSSGSGTGQLSFVSTIEELVERNGSGSGLENWEYVRRDQSRWPCGTFFQQRLALISLTSDGRSVGIVCSRTQDTKIFYVWLCISRFVSDI
jgi:hypothetical protein